MTKQTRREEYRNRIKVGKVYVKKYIDDSDSIFNDEIDEAYAVVLDAVNKYMNTVTFRTDNQPCTNRVFKKPVLDFITLFMPIFASDKIKKKHLKKIFKFYLKEFDKYKN